MERGVFLARDEKLMIRLDEKMKFQFQMYADRYGVTMSALGAVIIGEWVDAQNLQAQAREKVLETAQASVKQKLDEPLTDETIEQLKVAAPSFVKMLESFANEITRAKA